MIEFDKLLELVRSDGTWYKRESVTEEAIFFALRSPEIAILDSITRHGLVRGAFYLRSKKGVDSIKIYQLLLPLFKCQDKMLRKMIFNFIVSDTKKRVNGVGVAAFNSDMQKLLTAAVTDNQTLMAKYSARVLAELYRRLPSWRSTKVVSILANACFSSNFQVMVTALKFFLGCMSTDQPKKEHSDSSEASCSDEDEDAEKISAATLRKLKTSLKVGRKTQKKIKKLKAAEKKNKNKRKKNSKLFSSEECNLLAVEQIADSYAFTDRLVKQFRSTNARWEVKIMMLELCARIIGTQQLQLSQFFSLVQRYLNPKYRDITHILLYAAQACHNLVPPEDVQALTKCIADQFVTDRISPEGIALGLNALREIVIRCPYAIEQDLLDDVVQYMKFKNRNVTSACKALINALREKNPGLLSKKDRGKPTVASMEWATGGEEDDQTYLDDFGKVRSIDYVKGAEVELVEAAENAEGSNVSTTADTEDADEDLDEEEMSVCYDTATGNEAEVEMLQKEKLEIRAKQAAEVTASRIFTQEDHERIKEYQESKRGTFSSKKIEAETLVKMSNIIHLSKRPKMTKKDRLECKEESEKSHRFQVKRLNEMASTTNRQKCRKKPFSMVKQKAKGKRRRSFQQRQRSLKKQLQTWIKFRRN